MTSCKTCRFHHYVWREGDEYTFTPDYAESSQQARHSDFVQCRRSPPVVVGSYQHGIDTIWPTVQPDDWCGKYLVGDVTTMIAKPPMTPAPQGEEA